MPQPAEGGILLLATAVNLIGPVISAGLLWRTKAMLAEALLTVERRFVSREDFVRLVDRLERNK